MTDRPDTAAPTGPAVPAARGGSPAVRRPLLHGIVVTNLRRVGPVDPVVVLSGPLRLLRIDRLGPGERAGQPADGAEHLLLPVAGGGHVTTAGTRAPLRPGEVLTLPPGRPATVTAGPAGLEYLHAVLAPEGGPS